MKVASLSRLENYYFYCEFNCVIAESASWSVSEKLIEYLDFHGDPGIQLWHLPDLEGVECRDLCCNGEVKDILPRFQSLKGHFAAWFYFGNALAAHAAGCAHEAVPWSLLRASAPSEP